LTDASRSPLSEDLLRTLAPQVLGALVRRYGHFDHAEDAVQQAMAAAVRQWPTSGTPDDPRAWLVRVASRRLIDLLRSDQARRRREEAVVLPEPRVSEIGDVAGDPAAADRDDTLIVLFMCCHPSLTPPSQVALTLRAVGGLSTGEIARAFLVPEATMTRRITRAKQTVKDSGARFVAPTPSELDDRLAAVLHVLYLVFNEGYAATTGPQLHRVDLCQEAIRLTRMLRTQLPDRSEVTGLLALMLLTDARREARTGPDGELVVLADQDRTLWDPDLVREGLEPVAEALPLGPIGPFQVQAAIAAVHDEASSADATDWAQIVQLYEVLLEFGDNPIVALNHAVAVGMADGPRAGLDRLATVVDDGRLTGDHRVHAVRAELLHRAGDLDEAAAEYDTAIRFCTRIPVRRHLQRRLAELDDLR
jgi:RNA polymerase sigma factor (sigma-70 family)